MSGSVATLSHIVRFLSGKAWEKLNVVTTLRELKELGHRYGRRFFIAAVLWELVEDVLFPYLSWKAGVPALIPVFLILHFEPVVYPVFFWVFRTWDRCHGLESWEPPRGFKSTHARAGVKQLSYRVLSILLFFLVLQGSGLSLWLLTAYTILMAFFGFVHDRIWHDMNYGIDVPTDQVGLKRVVIKVLSYRVVSALVMTGLFLGLGLEITPVVIYQCAALLVHLIHEGIWSHNKWGILPTGVNP